MAKRRRVIRKTVRRTKRKTATSKPTVAKPRNAVQEALQITWVLKGHLKNAQIAYIRVGALLARVRDQNLFGVLKHPDLESYARERLQLGKSSLYKYLRVYDWVLKFHKEWLEPRPKGPIPDLADVADLIEIEHKLEQTNLEPKVRADLEGLKNKALNGNLRKSDLESLHKNKGKPGDDGLKSLLSQLRTIRRRSTQLSSMPAEALAKLDDAIGIIHNALAIPKAV